MTGSAAQCMTKRHYARAVRPRMRPSTSSTKTLQSSLRMKLTLGGRLCLQDQWMHNVPKRAGIAEPRINLTFRRVVHPDAR